MLKILPVDLYLRKKRWKFILFAGAVFIVAASLYYTSILVDEIRKDERKNVQIWADAIHQKADLVNYTNNLFEQLKTEERKRVSIVAEAQRRILTATSNEDLNFFLNIIGENTTIPVIVTDDSGNIMTSRNTRLDDSVRRLDGSLLREYSVYPPIVVQYIYNKKIYL